MVGYQDNIPGYRTIRVGPPSGQKSALADEQAWRTWDSYPVLAFANGAAFGIARELEQGGWQFVSPFQEQFPQQGRDSLGHLFRVMASKRLVGSDEYVDLMRAAVRMDWQAINETTVLGTRYRVIRIEHFVRTGPLGPEPPRPADSDPGGPGSSDETPGSIEGFVMDPVTSTTMSRGILTVDLLDAEAQSAVVPEKFRDDLLRAARTHPGGVLLPPGFTIARLTRGRWGPVTGHTSPNPRDARHDLALHLRGMLPDQLDLSDDERAACAAAADRVEEDQGDDVSVAGQRLRIVRVEQLVRFGPDGPEGPRPSDIDPYPPVMIQDDDSDDDDQLGEPADEAERWERLFHEEEARLAAQRAQPPGHDDKG